MSDTKPVCKHCGKIEDEHIRGCFDGRACWNNLSSVEFEPAKPPAAVLEVVVPDDLKDEYQLSKSAPQLTEHASDVYGNSYTGTVDSFIVLLIERIGRAETEITTLRERNTSQAEMLRTLGEKYSQLEMASQATNKILLDALVLTRLRRGGKPLLCWCSVEWPKCVNPICIKARAAIAAAKGTE